MRKSRAILMAVGVALVAAAAAFAITFVMMNRHFEARIAGDDDSLSLGEFATVERYIERYYLKDFDMKEVQYAGLKAMVGSLGDPYSVYYTPEEFDSFTQNAAGEYYGVGMLIAEEEETGLVIIEHVYNASPAQLAGIEEGDYIISIDGEDVAGKTLQEISLLSTGEEGTPVTMGIMRGGEITEYDMIRRAITMDMLSYEMLDDETGYMRIYQFGGNCSVLFAEAMGHFKEQGVRGIVVDLRDNPGGYFNTVVEVLDMLLPEGTLVYTEDKYGNQDISASDMAAIDIPLTLIVNENTASAAEIFAGAVQDFGYGEVVGETTYGKGLVQAVLPIPSTGGGIKITTSEYFTPSGRSINGNGIYPDHYVELPESYLNDPSRENDTQFQKAVEVMKAYGD